MGCVIPIPPDLEVDNEPTQKKVICFLFHLAVCVSCVA